MLRPSLPLVGLLVARVLAAEISGSCAGTALCEEDVIGLAAQAGGLLQARAGSRSSTVSVLENHDSRGGNITFTISAEEFEDSYKVIPAKLTAAGLNMQNFDSHFLHFTTRGGDKLEGRPTSSDFPLKFTYAQGSPGEEAADVDLVQLDAKQGWWPFRDAASQRPDGESYDATQEDVDMAALADHVYLTGAELPAGWTVLHNITIPSRSFFGHSEEATDRVALYSQGTTCALAISGSDGNDVGDWLNNFHALWSKRFCGKWWYHRGFVNELEGILSSPAFAKEIVPRAANCSRSGRLVVVGHSLGGAVATNLAECLNAKSVSSWRKPEALRNFPRKEVWLYTYGAPATRRGVAAANEFAEDGAFKGRRFFAYDNPFCRMRYCAPWCCDLWSNWAVQDPVPWVAHITGFWHAKIAAVGLDKSGKKNEYWKATNEDTYVEPDSFLPRINPFSASQRAALVDEHMLGPTYKPRLASCKR